MDACTAYVNTARQTMNHPSFTDSVQKEKNGSLTTTANPDMM